MIRAEHDGAILTVVLDRAEKLNAFDLRGVQLAEASILASAEHVTHEAPP